jgi:hypothetical protein
VTGSYNGDSTHHTSSGQSGPVTAIAKSTPPPPGPGSVSVGKAKVSAKTATVKVSCAGAAGASCKVKLTLTVVETLKGGKLTAVAASAKKTTKKTVIVGSVTVTIAAGKGETIMVKLNGTGKKLLAKHNPLKTKLTITQAGKTITGATITFKNKKKR